MSCTAADHSFAVCAYGESPYLDTCIRSVLEQSVKSRVIVATSTPNAHVRAAAERFGLPLFVREGESGIAADWNFALECAETPLVTLAHQDDVYLPRYTERMLRCMNAARSPLLFSSDYAELRDGTVDSVGRLLNVKRLLRVPMRIAPGSRAARRLSLAFGDPICCPSVTYVRDVMLRHPFESGFVCDLDWKAWERLSREPGSFAYSPEVLMYHRIHPGSETTRGVAEGARRAEDLAMFRAFWPESAARFLAARYQKSEESNRL